MIDSGPYQDLAPLIPYNFYMQWSYRYWAILIVISALLLSGLSCNDESRNYEVRQALIKAMGTDQVLSLEIDDMVEKVKANQLGLQTGLDDMVDRNRTLLSLIKSVSKPGTPPDKNLAKAQKKMGDYLRSRVHQFESTMELSSIEEFEAAYSGESAELVKELNKVRALLLQYDPELRKAKPY